MFAISIFLYLRSFTNCICSFSSCEVRENRDEASWRKLHAHCLDVLRDAARHRPPCPIKLHFFDRLLQNNLQQQQQQLQQGQNVTDASPVLVTGLRLLNIFLEFQPDNIVNCCPSQIVMMIEPTIYSRHRAPVELLAIAANSLFTVFPPGTAVANAEGAPALAVNIQTRIIECLVKYLDHVADPSAFGAEYFWYSCNCVSIMKAAIKAAPDSMQGAMFSLLKAMNRLAKDHNQQPGSGILAPAKGQPYREVPTNAEYSTGPWFMFNALNGMINFRVRIITNAIYLFKHLLSICSCCSICACFVC